MKASDLKKLISKIPDDDEIYFFYEVNTIDCTYPKILHSKQIEKFYEETGIEYDDIVNEKYNICENDWLLLLDENY